MTLELTNGHGPQIGDPCPRECGGVLGVVKTEVLESAALRVRTLACRRCKCRPERSKQVLPLRYAPPQSPRS